MRENSMSACANCTPNRAGVLGAFDKLLAERGQMHVRAVQMSLLDNIRFSNGPDYLCNYFSDLLQTNRSKATEIINDQDIHFSTLYLLKPLLKQRSSILELNPLYRKAFEIEEALSGKLSSEASQKAEMKMRSARDNIVPALKWIISTAEPEDGMSSRYEQLIERCAAVLVRSLGNTAMLPELADMIFARNRRGALIHELVWVFFEARSPESLVLLIQRLNSSDSRDVKLAKNLLCFIPGISSNTLRTGPTLLQSALYWLQENKPFLYYTGESLHLCNKPMQYNVSQPAKYLCRPVSADSGKPLMRLNDTEEKSLAVYEKLTNKQQCQLADFSWQLYRRNVYQWRTWLGLPIDEQAALAARWMGGFA